MNKYYLRSIREDGFGECVMPDREKIDKFLSVAAIYSHIDSLPVSALAHPDLAKKIGWVENVEEQYQLFDKEDICCWHIVSKEWYKENKQNDLRRIVLVEKKQEENSDGRIELAEFKELANEYYKKLTEKSPIKGIGSHEHIYFTYGIEWAFNRLIPPVSGEPGGLQWQLCPKCNGQGTVSKPPYIAGDVNSWTASESSFQCNLCNGKKVIESPSPKEKELRQALENLMEAIPKQTEDSDWWEDNLTNTFEKATEALKQ